LLYKIKLATREKQGRGNIPKPFPIGWQKAKVKWPLDREGCVQKNPIHSQGEKTFCCEQKTLKGLAVYDLSTPLHPKGRPKPGTSFANLNMGKNHRPIGVEVRVIKSLLPQEKKDWGKPKAEGTFG